MGGEEGGDAMEEENGCVSREIIYKKTWKV